LQLNGYYRLPANEQIFVGGDFTYYFPDEETAFDVEQRLTWMEFNINGQYHFIEDDELRAYGLGGLNYISVRSSVEADGFEASDSESEIGLNIGGGVEYDLEFGLVYGELKFIISDADQLVLGGGIRIPLILD
ncbi:MAG: outer membrane beta-barrel protein, partial [Balneolales bacterium]